MLPLSPSFTGCRRTGSVKAVVDFYMYMRNVCIYIYVCIYVYIYIYVGVSIYLSVHLSISDSGLKVEIRQA